MDVGDEILHDFEGLDDSGDEISQDDQGY